MAGNVGECWGWALAAWVWASGRRVAKYGIVAPLPLPPVPVRGKTSTCATLPSQCNKECQIKK